MEKLLRLFKSIILFLNGNDVGWEALQGTDSVDRIPGASVPKDQSVKILAGRVQLLEGSSNGDSIVCPQRVP